MKTKNQKEIKVTRNDAIRKPNTLSKIGLATRTTRSMSIATIKKEEEDSKGFNSTLHQAPTTTTEEVPKLKFEEVDFKFRSGNALKTIISYKLTNNDASVSQDISCKLCNVKFTQESNMLKHVHVCHRIKIFSYSDTKKPLMLPDPKDPHRYCISCERSYATRKSYGRHLELLHKITIASKRRMIYPHTTPDVDDRNSHCNACERTFKTKYTYRYHLRVSHGMEVSPLARSFIKTDPDVLPDIDDPDYYCMSCERKYQSNSVYRRHLKSIHKIALPKLEPRHPNIEPDPDNPDNYCAACEKTLSNRANYRGHLKRIHKITVPPHPRTTIMVNPELKPDIKDPKNKFCKVCEYTYSSRESYRSHLRHAHKIKMPHFAFIVNPDVTPDEDDPNFCCGAFERTFQSKNSLRGHIINIHKLKLVKGRKSTIIYRDLVLVIDDPDHHCISCEKNYPTHKAYRNHLKRIHKMKLISLIGIPPCV